MPVINLYKWYCWVQRVWYRLLIYIFTVFVSFFSVFQNINKLILLWQGRPGLWLCIYQHLQLRQAAWNSPLVTLCQIRSRHQTTEAIAIGHLECSRVAVTVKSFRYHPHPVLPGFANPVPRYCTGGWPRKVSKSCGVQGGIHYALGSVRKS
jgi:hypothetical protein